QRRHQKIIEEAPSPFVDERMRETMGGQAVALAKAVQYESAGTVEFIVDADRNFYFLEMNTRLQVEHPVTEFISGIDLVEWMIRIADGEKLGFGQADVKLKGWSIESRVYAEDPERKFLPSSGRLIRYQPPLEEPDIRVDTGVIEGGDVAIFYDPMIAKVITYGADRTAAIETMLRALDEYYIEGVANNIAFLQSVLDHPRYRRGDLTTDFIADEYGGRFDPTESGASSTMPLILAAAIVNRLYRDRAAKINGQLPGHEKSVAADWVVITSGESYPVTLTPVEGGYSVAHAGQSYEITTDWKFGQPILPITIDNKPLMLQIRRRRLVYELAYRGMRLEAMVLSSLASRLNTYMLEKPAVDLSTVVCSPMPGLLLRLAVEVGQEVKAGEELAVVEAMKMENVLYADNDAKVVALRAAAGDSLVVDQPIIEFE
ncbi:MAG: acetyl/propionyl-CoA carboxylase subunit alpha, partial [Gammaproteobacteria bacterium]|nr:acetyl/propionyl-CoA carboxylase subunit alpha [Gammaproteobacteria bacterium]